MKLERIVQIHIALLASVGALLLGVAQGDLLLAALVIFAAATSVVFTDILNWLRLNRVVANLAALLALFACLSDFFQAGIRNQLLAVANLLVYLQIVLFYQRKNQRLYWQLAVLSLLQVVVSAALNVPVEFGVLLVLYAAVAISTLTFFFLQREIARVTALSRGGERKRRRAKSASGAKPSPGPAWRRLLETRPKVTLLLGGRRLAAEVVGRSLTYQILVIGLMTLAFSVVLFFSAPRLESGGRQGTPARTQSIVGFNSEISLNELDKVLESDEVVMRISFRDQATNDLYRITGDPYIRGSVLADYVLDDGVAKWKQRSGWVNESPESRARISDLISREPMPIMDRDRPLRTPPRRMPVRQDVTLQPLSEPVLFAVFPAFGYDGTSEDVAIQPLTQQLYSRKHMHERARREYRYSLLTTGLLGGLQVDVTPHAIRRRLLWNNFYLDQEMEQLTEFDAQRFPQLKAIADGIAQRQQLTGARRAVLARALRDQFIESGDYTYSLDFRGVQRTPGIDPVEDFVANHRTGHCEYFASALALMLRSQGIPSRLVVGFHCGEYNTVGGYYQVRQRHAHAWVEAYLEPADVPQELPPDSDVGPYGGWLRLDATPGANVDRSESMDRDAMDVVDDVLDYARLLWSDYVLGLTATRQKEVIYDPVTEKADPESWASFWSDMKRRRQETAQWLQSYLFSPYTLSVAALVAMLASLRWARVRGQHPASQPVARRVSRWTARLTGQASGDQSALPAVQQVRFYRRFERLMNRLSLWRSPGQTQREFAAVAEVRLQEIVGSDGLENQFTERIARDFYHVRFGGRPLSSEETAGVEAALESLERRVNGGSPRPPQPKTI